MDKTEDDLRGLLRRWFPPDHEEYLWSTPRPAWGGLSAAELWNLGCYETVTRDTYDLVDRRMAALG